MTESPDSVHALYRFYDASKALLYIGITCDPPRRFTSHRRTKEWWAMVATIAIETYGDRPSLMEAERNAIKSERPRYNIVHNEVRPLIACNGLNPKDFRDACPQCYESTAPWMLRLVSDDKYEWVNCVYSCPCGNAWESSYAPDYPRWAAMMP